MNGVEEFDADMKGSSDLFSGIVKEAEDDRREKSARNGGYEEFGIDGSVINSSLNLKIGLEQIRGLEKQTNNGE